MGELRVLAAYDESEIATLPMHGLGMGGIGYSMRDMSLERMVVIRKTQGRSGDASRSTATGAATRTGSG